MKPSKEQAKVIVLSLIISGIIIFVLEYSGLFFNTVYDCSSPAFNSFPTIVQEECVRSLEQELRNLIEQRILEERSGRLINV
jgi:hypothetical protein